MLQNFQNDCSGTTSKDSRQANYDSALLSERKTAEITAPYATKRERSCSGDCMNENSSAETDRNGGRTKMTEYVRFAGWPWL